MYGLKKTACFAVFFCLAFCAFAEGKPEESPKRIIKIASIAPRRSPWDIEQSKMAEEWTKISGNRIELQFLATTALGGEGAVIQKLRAVRPGQQPPLEGAVFTNLGIYELAPESQVLSFCIPFLFRNQAEVNYVFNALFGEVQSAIKAKGYELLGWFSCGWIYVATKESAETPEKLKNLRIAMGGFGSEEITSAFRLVGFKAENIASDKIAQSLKSPGGIQGIYTIPMYTYATQYHKSLPYILDVPLCPMFTAFVLSEKTWASIPEEYKDRFLEEVRKSMDVFIKTQDSIDRQYLELMQNEGVTLIKLSAAERAHWEQVLTGDAQKMIESGNTIFNQDFYNRITALLEEYRAAHKD
ncbi:MAG: TRAP transporter substrate-binding protein DctP [Treponema sp.]|jgi:TRAP-type C4-dicarboxylate transport system substrate-binding protein|nr:TRAP transporter substrate-binding protein DctP [Treponema sp.]